MGGGWVEDAYWDTMVVVGWESVAVVPFAGGFGWDLVVWAWALGA